MNYNDAEKVRAMIQGHWNLRMDDATCDLWLGALLPKEGEIAVKAVAHLAKTSQFPPKIVDLEEVYAMLVDNAALPPAESCPTCAGDQFVLVSKRKPEQTQWMEEHSIEVPAGGSMLDEMAPCPDCNPDCNVSFPRGNGTVFHGPDHGLVRERMAPTVHQPVPKGAQKLPGDVHTFLRDMRGISTEFVPGEAGRCDDCKRDTDRFAYGTYLLCERCCSRRQKVADELSMQDVVTVLHATQ